MPITSHPAPRTQHSRFITFEGGEGAGKSTQLYLLQEAFIKSGIKIEMTREPGGTAGAESIRNLLVNGDTTKWDAETELLLHLAARNDHVDKFIKPKLAEGYSIICDRFTDSTIAYQAYGHGLGKEYVSQFCNLVIGNFQPDLTIILDVDVQDGIKRTEKRNESVGNLKAKENRYEKMGKDFHETVRQGFLEIAKACPQRCVVINASYDIDAVHTQIIAAVKDRLGVDLGTKEVRSQK